MVPRGFRMWVKQCLKDDREQLAAYLYDCAMNGPKDSLVWDLLEEVGDPTFNGETFRKAADVVLKTEFIK